MTFVPANEGIAKLKPYQPGKPISELERELGITDIVKLASNENPLGCSDKVKDAVAAELAAEGGEVPVYRSANMPGATEINDRLIEKYKTRNPHL